MSTHIISSNHQKDDMDTQIVIHHREIGSKKTVSFEPYAKVWTVDLYPQNLHEDLWYSTQDYQDMKRRNAHDVQEAQLFGGAATILFRPSQYRGLECTLDESRKLNKFRSIQAVLMEQDRQQVEQEHDDEAGATLYQAYCVSSVEKAIRLAKMDAQDAQLALTDCWKEQGGDNDDNSVRCMESDLSDSSRLSDSDSLLVFQQRRRRRWTLPRQQIRKSGVIKKFSDKENDVDESFISHPNRLWMNVLAPMIPTRG
jgi:hypothetical protein